MRSFQWGTAGNYLLTIAWTLIAFQSVSYGDTGTQCLPLCGAEQSSVDSPPLVFQAHIDPRGTYLATNSDYPHVPTTYNLWSIGQVLGINIQPGTLFEISVLGDYSWSAWSGEVANNVVAVFVDANGSRLYPGPGSIYFPAYTPPTYYNSVPTDIPQDFSVFSSPSTIEVPQGAVNILFSVADQFYADNFDSDNNLQFRMEFAPAQSFDIGITDKLTLGQIIWDDPSWDNPGLPGLVSGRDAVVRTRLQLQWEGELPQDLPASFDVHLLDDQGNQVGNKSVDLADFFQNTTSESVERDLYLKFQPDGNRPQPYQALYTLLVDPNGVLPDQFLENNTATVSAYVYSPARFSIGLIEVIPGCLSDPGCYLPPLGGTLRFLKTDEVLIQDTFPIHDQQKVLFESRPSHFYGQTAPVVEIATGKVEGFKVDLLDLGILAKLQGLSYMAGVVHPSYFQYHGLEPERPENSIHGRFRTIGFAFYGFNAFLVGDEEGSSNRGVSGIVAHELVHAIGEGSHAPLNGAPPNQEATVFDYGIDAGGHGDPGENGFSATSFMNRELPNSNEHKLWIDGRSYYSVFSFLTQYPVDPEIIVLGGFIHTDGQFAPMHTRILPEGFVSSNSRGSYLVEARDRFGFVTFQQLFEPSFSHNGHDEGGEPFPDIAPLIVTLEWIPGTVEFRILKDGFVTSTFSAIGSSLRTAIETLPPEAFKKKQGNSKQLLINRVNQIERMATEKKWVQVRHFLLKLRGEIGERVDDQFIPANEGQQSKAQILTLVDRFHGDL